MTAEMSLRHRYDSTPYHDQAFHEFDISRLLGFAQLFGLREPSASHGSLRVLDLGCASGVHLREQARRYPSVHFEGIDFSVNEIELGRKAIEEEGLENIELMQADLRSIAVESGAYDVVLCHGVFSWVTDDVKERIFLLARQALRTDGIAAIAYLTYPGWKQLEAFRELLMMRVGVGNARDATSADERVRESAMLLRLLKASYDAAPNDVQAQSLGRMVERMQKSSSNAFIHDELGPVHDPCYFLQFAEWAEECGLAYLAETDLGTMSVEGLSETARPILEALAPSDLEVQQWLDFAVNRSGRSSMLVRSDANPTRQFSSERISQLSVGTNWWNVTPLNAGADSSTVLESPVGRRIEIEDPRIVSTLRRLSADRSRSMDFEDLILASEESAGETSELREALIGMLARGVIEPRAAIA